MTHSELNYILFVGAFIVIVGMVIAFVFFMRWSKDEAEKAEKFRKEHGRPERPRS